MLDLYRCRRLSGFFLPEPVVKQPYMYMRKGPHFVGQIFSLRKGHFCDHKGNIIYKLCLTLKMSEYVLDFIVTTLAYEIL